MKTNELMIGDWVNEGLFNVKISSFDDTQLHFEYVDSAYADIRTASRYLAECKPIPLTEDILNANGWTEFYYGHFEDENHRHFHRGSDRRLELSLIKGDKCFCTNFSLGRIDFYYVHELQHALRLCDRNDLADNFKVLTADGVPTPTSAPNR